MPALFLQLLLEEIFLLILQDLKYKKSRLHQGLFVLLEYLAKFVADMLLDMAKQDAVM